MQNGFPAVFAVKVFRNSFIDYLARRQRILCKRTCSKHVVLETIQDGPMLCMDLFTTMPHTFMSNFVQLFSSKVPDIFSFWIPLQIARANLI